MLKGLKQYGICLYFLLACTILEGRASPLENQIVGKLEIVIATQESSQASSQAIRSRLKTREGDLFSQSAFDTDLKMLAQDYDRVEPQVESVDGVIVITIKVWPNPVIRSIIWEGNKRIKTSKLQGELGISRGQTFDRQKFNQAFHQVKAYYIKKGFFEAELDYKIEYNEPTHGVDLVISIKEGRAGKIKNISFCNFTKKEQNCLLEKMVTKKYNFFLSWFNGSGIYNEEMIQHDQFQILNYLQNEGYADANVEIKVVEAKEKDRIIICITAEKGERYFFDEVSLEGNTLFSDEELMKRIRIKKGDPYSPEAIQDATRRLTNYYGRFGYIEASINYAPRRVEGQPAYAIRFAIEEGEQYRVGLIKVLGNRCTQTKVILHETLLIPGEVFNLQKLQLTEKRLCNIGFFKNVNVYAVKAEEECVLPGNYRDVHIEVEETSTGSLGAFFGFSTTENMFGGINLTERNFNFRGLGCFWTEGMCALRGGGEYAHITLSLGAKGHSYALSWTKPYFMDTPWSVGFDIDRTSNEYYSDHYSIKGVGLTLHATYECNAFMRVGTHYRIRYTDVDFDDDACDKAKKQAEDAGLISALGYSWQYDSTNHPIKPTHGIKSRFDTEVAGIGGDTAFLSFGYLNCMYYDLWGQGTLKLRGDLRFIQPMRDQNPNKIPLDERFFLGGDNTVRGYRSYRLGPKFQKRRGDRCTTDEEEPAGGISMQLFSVELSRSLFSCVDPFVFFDAGALSSRRWNFGGFNLSAGLGARLQVFGNAPPLMVGYGWPLNPRSSSDVKRFFITVGGKF